MFLGSMLKKYLNTICKSKRPLQTKWPFFYYFLNFLIPKPIAEAINNPTPISMGSPGGGGGGPGAALATKTTPNINAINILILLFIYYFLLKLSTLSN